MATKKKKSKKSQKSKRQPRPALWVTLGVLAALALTLIFGVVNANTVHVRRARVRLKDLPQAFEGRTILYATDIDLCGLNTAAKSAALFDQLQALKPDALILGGDYTSKSLFDLLNSAGKTDVGEAALEQRAAFIESLKDFNAPLGKFAICAEADADQKSLKKNLKDAGFEPLFDTGEVIAADGAKLYLVGLTSEPSAIGAAARAVNKSDCVVAVAANPSLIPQMMISEAADSGAWCDLILTGGTHGGQVRLFGLNVGSLNGIERNYLRGWKVESGIPILTSTGVGCEALNVRLGSQAEVWLIQLEKA